MSISDVLKSWAGAFAPPPRILPSEFAEAEIYLPSSSSSTPGPLRFASYQRELVDALADDEVETIVLMLSSQVGKSTTIDALMGYCIACEPGPMMHVSPTGSRSEEFVRDRFDPLVSASPTLQTLVGKGQDTRKGSSGGANSLSSKSFPGGQLSFASAHKPDELAARAIKFLFLDEVDRFPVSAGIEGSPIQLAVKRTKTFEGKGRKIIAVSTPTSRTASRINHWFLKGDQRRFIVTCPDCEHPGPLSFDNLKWEEGRPETAYLRCSECGAVHDEACKRAMVAAGYWEATAVGEKGVRSYHLNELASMFSTLESVARSYESAATPEEKQAFHNTALAQVYDASTEVELSSSELQQRAEPLSQPYPADIMFVTAGVDVQGNRLECTYLAHHSGGTQSVLNHVKLPGDTSGDAVWQDLDRALGETFLLSNGNVVAVAATAVDSGFSADQVMKFVHAQRRKRRSIYAVKGASGFDRLPLARGGKLKGQMQLLIVGVDTVKHAVQRHLAMTEIEPGYIRLPDHLPSEYFDGLASEELRVRYINGNPRHFYHRTVRQNEPLDCLIYASAIAKTVNVQSITTPATPGSSMPELAARLHAAHNS